MKWKLFEMKLWVFTAASCKDTREIPRKIQLYIEYTKNPKNNTPICSPFLALTSFGFLSYFLTKYDFFGNDLCFSILILPFYFLNGRQQYSCVSGHVNQNQLEMLTRHIYDVWTLSFGGTLEGSITSCSVLFSCSLSSAIFYSTFSLHSPLCSC